MTSGASKAVRLVLISDTHTRHWDLEKYMPEGDVLVHAGDFANRCEDIEQIHDFNRWLGTLNYPHKVVIAGNQEYPFNHMKVEDIQKMMSNCHYLQDSGCELLGIKLYGSPWQGSQNMAFSASREQRAAKWNLIPAHGGVDVLITHVPPHGILDIVTKHGEARGWGDHSLLRRVEDAIRPSLHVFGHVHETQEGGRRAVVSPGSGVTYVNAASKADGGTYCSGFRPPMVVEFNPSDRSVRVVGEDHMKANVREKARKTVGLVLGSIGSAIRGKRHEV